MILYNITFNVEADTAVEWQDYFKAVHMPYLQNVAVVNEVKLLKLMNEMPEIPGTTFACQLLLEGQEELELFYNDVEEEMYSKLHERFSGKFVYFNTILQEI